MQPPLSSNPLGIIITENRNGKKKEERRKNENKKTENWKPTSDWPLQCSHLSRPTHLESSTPVRWHLVGQKIPVSNWDANKVLGPLYDSSAGPLYDSGARDAPECHYLRGQEGKAPPVTSNRCVCPWDRGDQRDTLWRHWLNLDAPWSGAPARKDPTNSAWLWGLANYRGLLRWRKENEQKVEVCFGSMLWKYASPNRRKGKRRSWMELGLVGSSSSIHLANYRRPPARDSCMKGAASSTCVLLHWAPPSS